MILRTRRELPSGFFIGRIWFFGQNEQKDLDIDFMPEIDVLPEITDSDDLKKLPSDNSFMEDVKSS